MMSEQFYYNSSCCTRLNTLTVTAGDESEGTILSNALLVGVSFLLGTVLVSSVLLLSSCRDECCSRGGLLANAPSSGVRVIAKSWLSLWARNLRLMSASRFSARSLAESSCSSDLEHGRHNQELLSTVLNEYVEPLATQLCRTVSRWLFPGLLRQRRALGSVRRWHNTQSKHELAMLGHTTSYDVTCARDLHRY